MAAIDNQWDTDPYGDPTLPPGSNPWTSTAVTGGPGSGDAAQPSSVPSPGGDAAAGGVTPWTESNPFDTSPTPQDWPQTSAAATTPDVYDSHLSNIAQAPDPATQATAQDGLARQLQSDLEADGHSVKWSGATTLSVDGRAYELGSGQQFGTHDPPVGSDTLPAGAGAIPTNPDGSQVGGGIAWDPKTGAPASNPPGYHWDPTLAMFQPGDAPGTTTTTTTADRMDDNAILAQIASWAKMPGADPSLGTNPNYWLNAIKSRGGLGADNQQFWQDASVGDTAFFRNPGREGGGATSGAGAGGTGPTSPWLTTSGSRSNPTYPAWSPSTPNYAPGSIDASASELPGYKDILDTLNTPGEGDAALQKLVQSIVEHPQTLTDQDIEELKAKSAEEAAVAGQSQDEELKHYGYNSGLDTSPWLAGQRAQNAWNRSNSTITANRGIDIAAADRRQGDRQQAATIGQAYSSFQSSKKAQAVGLAVQAALGKAGEQRSRTQLNESLKQAATQLGLTKDSLVMTYLGHVMTDLTNNKQLDLNFDVDMKKLAAQSDEFKQTLLQRMHELAQSDDQFRANYGLAAQEFQHKKDQDAWERAKSATA